MIQRIQSVFLLLAGLAGLGLLRLPFASTAQTIPASSLFQDSLYTIQDHPALMGLFLAGAALALIAIFLFKNRKLQGNLARISFIAILIGFILAIVFFMNDVAYQGAAEFEDDYGIFLPFVSLIFLILAMRGINKDEKMVRSMDRLR